MALHEKSNGYIQLVLNKTAGTQTLVEIVILRIFRAKKLKKLQKSDKFAAKFCKNMIFLVCTKTLVEGFIPKKTAFLLFLKINKSF